MVQLETVEDFEKVRKAIKNLDSQPWEYIIQYFGFCSACEAITPYRCDDLGAQCLMCKRVFDKESGGFTLRFVTIPHRYYYVASIEDIPTEKFRDECKLHYSREYQKRLFFEKLESQIKDLKHRAREANNKVRRLAKFRD